jgi:hypothetical protein
MSRDEKPDVVDLRAYKKAAEARAKAARKAPRPAGTESFLGSRPHAGLILAGIALLVILVALLPRLL